VFANAGDIDRSAAVTPRTAAGQLRRQLHASVPHRIFPRRGVTLVPPFLEIGIGERRQDPPPGGFEVGARVIEIDGGAALVLVRFDARIEAAAPFPLVDIDRAAHAAGNGADVNVSVIDVLAVLALRISAAGEGGHVP
jgi:hypothetical protein